MSKLLLSLIFLGGCTTTDWSGSSTEVKEVDHRYEVRRINNLVNHLLFTFQTHEEAYDYVVKQPSPYSDLIIHDLKTGETFEETP